VTSPGAEQAFAQSLAISGWPRGDPTNTSWQRELAMRTPGSVPPWQGAGHGENAADQRLAATIADRPRSRSLPGCAVAAM
jgi:hypothetical protein